MSAFTVLIVTATLATVIVLGLGISSMVRDGEVAHLDSEKWMASRVLLQAVAILALIAAVAVGR
jgi:hypothetical protein